MLEWPSDVWVLRCGYVVCYWKLARDERAVRSAYVCMYVCMYVYMNVFFKDEYSIVGT